MRTIGLLGIFLIMLGCLGCNHNEAAGRLRFWQAVSGEADQVSERLEESLRHDFDSAQNAADVARLKVLADSIEKTDDGRIASLLKARVLYWRSYGEYMAGSDSLMRLYADSAFNIINRLTANGNEAPELNYDRARIMEVYALTLPHDTLRARMYGSALREFKAAGDSLHLSITYGRIGTMMSAMSNLREGQKYFVKASEYAQPGSRPAFITAFNLLVNLQDMKNQGVATSADSLRAPRLAEELMRNRYFPTRPGAVKMHIFKGRYDGDGNRVWLDSALAVSGGIRKLAAQAWMARHFLQRGETDSARNYAEEVLAVTGLEGENLDYCVNYDDITALCRDYLRSIGDSARAEIFAELHHQFTSRTSEETSLFIAVANMFKQNELEMAHLDFDSERKQAERLRAWWVGISAGLLMLAVAALMIIRVKRRRKRRDDARIAQEERQRAESLLHEMSCGEAETDDWAKFSVLFSNAHPGFIAGLESRYQALTKGDVKMACYTLAGLETKQIARLMNINPASVMKNRHRLRSKLGLSPDENLDRFLRSLASQAE